MPKKYTYNKDLAERPIKFIEKYVQHINGDRAGQPFLLEPWQKEITREVFGWVDKAGRRKHRFIYIEVPKGNGKSMFLSAITIYLSCAEGQTRAENYCVAGDRSQARILHDACKAMVEESPRLQAAFQVYRDSIVHSKSQSTIKVLSSEAYSKHGYRPYCIAFDELHVQPNRELYDTLTKGLIKIKNSICFMITTAGVKDTFAETIHDYAMQLSNGIIKDEHWYVKIYAAEEKDDPFSENTWQAANPGYGTIIDPENFQIIVKEARNNPSALNSFKRLHLNQWTGALRGWIEHHIFEKCHIRDIPLDDYAKGKIKCYGGLDVASTADLTAFSLLFDPGDGILDWKCWFWCPEETIRDRIKSENVNYEAWARAGWIFTTPGNVQDKEMIKTFLVEQYEKFNVQSIGFDPKAFDADAAELSTKFGLPFFKFIQTITEFTAPTKEMERKVRRQEINYEGNPVLAWQMNNTEVFSDSNDNIRPMKGAARGQNKGRKRNKIDGIVAGIMAVGEWMDAKAREKKKPYQESGIRYL